MINKNNKKTGGALGLLLWGGVFLTVGDILAGGWARAGGLHLYISTLILYLLGMIVLVESYKKENIPVASIILVMFNVVILTFAGYFIFDEIITVSKVVGIALCFVSIYLLQSSHKS